MSSQVVEQTPSSLARRAYILLRLVEELENVRGGVNTAYGAEQCNKLLEATQQLAASDPDILGFLNDIRPLDTQFHPFYAGRLAAEANIFLARVKGTLRAIIGLYMDKKERHRLGV